MSPCSWIAKIDSENEFSEYWPQNSISECIKKFDNFRDVVNKRKEKFEYCGCIALSRIYNGKFLDADPLNEFLGK